MAPNATAEALPKNVEELPPMGVYATQVLRGQIAQIQAGIPSFVTRPLCLSQLFHSY